MSHSCSGRASPPSGVSTRSGGGFVATGCDGSEARQSGPNNRPSVGTLRTVHPIERLRYVARARGADAESLVRETAGALRDWAPIRPSRRGVPPDRRTPPDVWAAVVAGGAAADERRPDGRDRGGGRDQGLAAADVLASELPDGATVATVGWPEIAGQAIARRGNLRVLAVEGQSFVQRLERSEIECDLVPMDATAIATAHADVVLVEADALDTSRLVRARRLGRAGRGGRNHRDAGVDGGRLWPAVAEPDDRSHRARRRAMRTTGCVRRRPFRWGWSPTSWARWIVGPHRTGGDQGGVRDGARSCSGSSPM